MKLILHIGSEKTGTTAIQHFLADNRALLKQQGYYYPSTDFCDFAHFSLVAPFHSLDNNGKPLEFIPKNNQTSYEVWEPIKEIFEEDKDAKVIISAEHFSSRLKEKGIEALKQMIDWVNPNLDVEIVYYVRRQDEYFESWYSTHVKAGGTLTVDEAFKMRLNQKWFYDHYFIVSHWINMFSNAEIKVVPFEKTQLKNHLFEDFCDRVGLIFDSNFKINVKDSNEAWSFPFLDLAREVNLYHQVNPLKDRYAFLTKISRYFEYNKKSFISDEKKLLLLDKYSNSNIKLAKDLLNRDWFFESSKLSKSYQEPNLVDIQTLISLLVKGFK